MLLAADRAPPELETLEEPEAERSAADRAAHGPTERPEREAASSEKGREKERAKGTAGV